ncbi:DUF3304 domain-containing protein [Lysobacter sp. FW306-1B-D06B]|uniref:DUF3304 domain-containing protein n=1 Tax=Lysobacter sp. FW306-1B-D06B TaxID=3140250 RepID=UPI0031401AA0
MCCAKLPNRWREGLKVEVRWNVTNWRDCTGADYVRRVPVEPYHRPDSMYVHFLADGGVKVVSTPWYPEKANRPNSQYPIKDPIPDKAPWRKYPRDETCKKKEAVTRANKGTP